MVRCSRRCFSTSFMFADRNSQALAQLDLDALDRLDERARGGVT